MPAPLDDRPGALHRGRHAPHPKTGTNSFDDSDFVDALYRQELSACCTHHCVNHYDENGLALAARADVVEAGKAPEAVKKLAAKFA